MNGVDVPFFGLVGVRRGAVVLELQDSHVELGGEILNYRIEISQLGRVRRCVSSLLHGSLNLVGGLLHLLEESHDAMCCWCGTLSRNCSFNSIVLIIRFMAPQRAIIM